MKKLLSAFAFLMAFAIVATSCGDDETSDDPQPSKIAVESVTITPDPASTIVGGTLTFKAEIKPENATVKTVEWFSRNTSVAKIDKETGEVTGVAIGEVQIYATCDKVVSNQVTLTVAAAPIRVEKVELNKSELPLFVGKSETLTATITPANATNQEMVWKSDNEAVATVEAGKVTAVAEGTANITVTVDEKEATCKVIVSIPDISITGVSTIAEGETINITGVGFKAGDQVQLEALVGVAYTSPKIDLTATATGASFAFPGDALKERSYKMTVLREDAAKAIAYVRPDNEVVTLPYHLGYYLVGADQVEGLETDPAMKPSGDDASKIHRGYINGKMAEYNPETKEFKIWKKDAALAPLVTGGTFDMTYATGVTDIQPMFELFGNLTDVTRVYIANSSIEELDMTRFPNATMLHAWGDPGSHLNKLTRVNFGTYTDDEHALKVQQIQVERNQIKELDLRNCIYCTSIVMDDNQITKVELGHADGIEGQDKDRMLTLYSLSAKRNQIREIDLTNCGRLRQLWLEGNKIERIKLQNNALGDGPNSPRPDEWFPYVYILKGTNSFSITWATAAEAQGERVIDVEQYWWRVFSEANGNETPAEHRFEGGWVENNPIVQALKDGFKVNCWTYWNEGKGATEPHILHTHQGGENPCSY